MCHFVLVFVLSISLSHSFATPKPLFSSISVDPDFPSSSNVYFYFLSATFHRDHNPTLLLMGHYPRNLCVSIIKSILSNGEPYALFCHRTTCSSRSESSKRLPSKRGFIRKVNPPCRHHRLEATAIHPQSGLQVAPRDAQLSPVHSF